MLDVREVELAIVILFCGIPEESILDQNFIISAKKEQIISFTWSERDLLCHIHRQWLSEDTFLHNSIGDGNTTTDGKKKQNVPLL